MAFRKEGEGVRGGGEEGEQREKKEANDIIISYYYTRLPFRRSQMIMGPPHCHARTTWCMSRLEMVAPLLHPPSSL